MSENLYITSRQLQQKVIQSFFGEQKLPSIIGGQSTKVFFQLCTAIKTCTELYQHSMIRDTRWIDSDPTWYTKNLPSVTQIHRFPDETDTKYIERLFAYSIARELGGNGENSIREVVKQLLGSAIVNPETNIRFISVSGLYEWKDQAEELGFALYSREDPLTGELYTWGDITQSLRATFVIEIQFQNLGADNDPLNYEYWIKSQNYTKIQDVVNNFKAPGSTFELRLLSP
jgi:hypothetical protein